MSEALTLPNDSLAVPTPQAAKMIGVAEKTLTNWRYQRPYDGPPYAKIGAKVVYPVEGLREFIATRVVLGAAK